MTYKFPPNPPPGFPEPREKGRGHPEGAQKMNWAPWSPEILLVGGHGHYWSTFVAVPGGR